MFQEPLPLQSDDLPTQLTRLGDALHEFHCVCGFLAQAHAALLACEEQADAAAVTGAELAAQALIARSGALVQGVDGALRRLREGGDN